MPRRAARKDRNHDEVCDALQRLGWTVIQTHQVGDGFPDCLAARRGHVLFVEIKDGELSPSRRQLTPDEQRFRDRCEVAGLHYRVVMSLEDVARL